jgi:hypothetical protein
MPTNTAKESKWKKFIPNIKDTIYIILFLSTTYGWIRSATINKTKMEDKVQNLTEALQSNTKQLEKITDILLKQSELNGKVIMHIETDK